MQVKIHYPGTGITRHVTWGIDDLQRHVVPRAHARFFRGEVLRAHGPATVVEYQLISG